MRLSEAVCTDVWKRSSVHMKKFVYLLALLALVTLLVKSILEWRHADEIAATRR